MCTKRDVLIFVAGAVFFHMLSHIMLPFIVPLPINMGFMILTKMMNMWIIVTNAVITLALLWFAGRIKS